MKQHIEIYFWRNNRVGYKYEETSWMCDRENWYPIDLHHHCFYFTHAKIGMFIGAIDHHFFWYGTQDIDRKGHTSYSLHIVCFNIDKCNRHV
jgi:hypothetical protein